MKLSAILLANWHKPQLTGGGGVIRPYTIEEVAELVGFSRDTVSRWINEGVVVPGKAEPVKLSVVRFGAARSAPVRVRREKLLDFLQALEGDVGFLSNEDAARASTLAAQRAKSKRPA